MARRHPDSLSSFPVALLLPKPGMNRSAAEPPRSCHRLGPRHVPLEAERCGHGTVAIPIVAVCHFVAARPGQQRAQPQQHDLAHRPTVTCPRFANRSIACSASDTSPSAPRSSSVSTKAPVAHSQIPELSPSKQIVHRHPHHWYGTIALAAPGPRTCGDYVEVRYPMQIGSLAQPPVAQLRQQFEPALASAGACRCICTTPHTNLAKLSTVSSLSPSAVCTASSIARTAESSARSTP